MCTRQRRLPALLLTATGLLATGPRLASAQLLGPEIQINSHSTNAQGRPAVAADAAGNFVVVWDGEGQDGSGAGIFGQRFDAAGLPQGSEFQVNTATASDQEIPAVAVDGSGDFVVVWQSYLPSPTWHDVFGQRFDAAGLPQGNEFQVNTNTPDRQWFPAVAAADAGEFVVIWDSDVYVVVQSYGIAGQLFDAAGAPLGSEFAVTSDSYDFQGSSTVAADGAGNFVVVWESCVTPFCATRGYGQRFDAGGLPVGGTFLVDPDVGEYQFDPALAVDGAGNFVVVWTDPYQEGSYGVFGQRFAADGASLGEDFHVNTHTTGAQRNPAVAADADGNFLVVWRSQGQDGSGDGVYGQRFGAAGQPVGGEFRVNSFTPGDQRYPAVAATGAGNFVVTWESDGQDGSGLGVFGRRVVAAVFSDGFEADDVCAWSATVGGPCP